MLISFWSLTLAALTNGLNPCGIGMMITFLGYLLVFGSGKKDKYFLVKLGMVYVGAVFVTYLFIGLLFYGLAFYLQRLWLASVFKYVIGIIIMLAGLIQLKDGIWPDSPIHLRMPDFGGKKINGLMEKMSLPMAALVGIAVTAFSTPCMLPLYVGTASLIARSGLPMISVLSYFLYYNLIFILPLIVVLVLMNTGKQVVAMKEWEHKYGRWMRLLMGLVLVVVGYLIVFG
jgi:cytochrome c biogenesis protein CcdA